MSSAIKVLLVDVDDHRLFSEGVVSLLSTEPDIVVTDIAFSAEECVRLVRSVSPDTVLLDINLLDSCGVDMMSKIKQINSDIGIVIFGFLLKDCTKEEMLTAIRQATKGEGYFSQNMVPYQKAELVRPSQEDSHDDKIASLTSRELEIFKWVVTGLRSKEIAENLGIAKRTVDYHIGNILLKLEVKSRLEIVLKYKIG